MLFCKLMHTCSTLPQAISEQLTKASTKPQQHIDQYNLNIIHTKYLRIGINLHKSKQSDRFISFLSFFFNLYGIMTNLCQPNLDIYIVQFVLWFYYKVKILYLQLQRAYEKVMYLQLTTHKNVLNLSHYYDDRNTNLSHFCMIIAKQLSYIQQNINTKYIHTNKYISCILRL